ncbi:FAD-dependent monooxygenase [Kutzneria kofuensis]|uniref:2-polyprenyl-6-methoxyphenol hydroxylase-like FAD-dependent oxidoreductase n=1 Tax=Kutzneria kofuensis TaxID=103725 RepID=A0A7W9KCD0_9PSEU|nr:FAD-dependent monooxygenase [Kutzneria kofuensis]MBB5889870.1 2-polyprenyl-6-methoxyphenol hydroxylase-like FAD-dependent oxidoreductase [Kutzneria kofuensis]
MPGAVAEGTGSEGPSRAAEDTDVLVIGAGPVGLTLATALRRQLLRVRVVDRATGPNREARADVIFPRAGEALGALGVGETIRRHAYEMRSLNFYGDGRHLGCFTAGRFDSDYPYAMTIEQHDIELLLAEELSGLGVDVEWRTEATDVRQRDDHALTTLRLPTGVTEMARASWVVACDGRRSTVRTRLGIPFDGKRRVNMQVVQGNVVPAWPLRDRPGQGYIFLGPRCTVLAFPTPGQGYRVFCIRDDPEPDRTEPPTLGELRDLVADTAGIPLLRLGPTESGWLSRARFSDRIAAEFRRGRVLLAGDAAHAWAPVGGHGMNIGMLGAHNLAWKLAAVHHRQAGDALLDSYDIEQRALARAVIRDMRFNITEILLPEPLHRVRTAVLRAALPWSGFQRRVEWLMSDFGRNHRDSPLSRQEVRRIGRQCRAGDRIPDVYVTREAGAEPVRLHRLLGYDRWTLLLAVARAEPAVVRRLERVCADYLAAIDIVPIAAVDRSSARQLAGVHHVTLVRPDGYVGLVAPLDDVDALRDYLAAFLVPRDPGPDHAAR